MRPSRALAVIAALALLLVVQTVDGGAISNFNEQVEGVRLSGNTDAGIDLDKAAVDDILRETNLRELEQLTSDALRENTQDVEQSRSTTVGDTLFELDDSVENRWEPTPETASRYAPRPDMIEVESPTGELTQKQVGTHSNCLLRPYPLPHRSFVFVCTADNVTLSTFVLWTCAIPRLKHEKA